MDPVLSSSAAHVAVNYVPLVASGLLAATAGITTAVGISASRRGRSRLHRWQSVGASLGLQGNARRGDPPTLTGTYRNRAMEAVLLPGGIARITACIANPRHLLDRVSAADAPRTSAPWLNAVSRAALGMLPATTGKDWNIDIKGNHLTLTAPCPLLAGRRDASNDPRPLRALLDLTCDLSESVDAAPPLALAKR